jgi:hypothetical protein
VEITKYLAGYYPSMIPATYENQIHDLLSQLHDVSFFGITFAGKPQAQEAGKVFLKCRLQDSISDEYRDAILHKLHRWVKIYRDRSGEQSLHCEWLTDIKKHWTEKDRRSLTLEERQKNETYVKQLMPKFEQLVRESRTGWLLGLEHPSAIDAHLIVFVARVLDVNREDLLPTLLVQWAKKAMEGKEWREVMQGRSTIPPIV